MISVLLTTFNGEKYIYEQIDSIRTQSMPADEVIIADDCSSDNTVNIVKSFINNHQLLNWHLFVNPKNLGLKLNGLSKYKYIRGDIVFFSDQDDVWKKNKIEVMSNIMYSNSQAMLLSSMYRLIGSGGDHLLNDPAGMLNKKEKENGSLRKLGFHSWLGYSKIPGCSICVRKELIDLIIRTGRPDLSKSIGGDWFIGMISEILGKSYRIQTVLFDRRIHESNASLSRLKKETALSSTLDNRLLMLKQAVEGHQFFLDNQILREKLNHTQEKQIKKMISFIEKRYEFTKNRKFLNWIHLFFHFNQYFLSSNSIKNALRMWISDFLYAYSINWKIRK